jgi:hypothetical protein
VIFIPVEQPVCFGQLSTSQFGANPFGQSQGETDACCICSQVSAG